ncbi:MAG TPA: cytochrome c [Kiloniellales bacterium]|jgi:cytochrome c556|nr:cytochrome c [Kiloniellales bacterium]
MRPIGSLSVAAAVGFLLLTPALAEADPAALIQERQEFMKELGSNLKAIRDYVQQGTGSPEEVAEAARHIGERADEIPDLFPEGTGMNEVDIETGARPEIWEDPEDFAAKAASLREAALNFADQAEQNGDDRATMGRGLATLGRDGCGACHQVYREDLD